MDKKTKHSKKLASQNPMAAGDQRTVPGKVINVLLLGDHHLDNCTKKHRGTLGISHADWITSPAMSISDAKSHYFKHLETSPAPKCVILSVENKISEDLSHLTLCTKILRTMKAMQKCGSIVIFLSVFNVFADGTKSYMIAKQINSRVKSGVQEIAGAFYVDISSDIELKDISLCNDKGHFTSKCYTNVVRKIANAHSTLFENYNEGTEILKARVAHARKNMERYQNRKDKKNQLPENASSYYALIKFTRRHEARNKTVEILVKDLKNICEKMGCMVQNM